MHNTPQHSSQLEIRDDKKRDRDDKVRERMAKLAITEYKVLESYAGKFSLVKYKPITGRKHQLRITSQHLSCPIVGDKKYGYHASKRGLAKNLFLHCTQMEFEINGKSYSITAPLPEHFKLFSN